MFKRIFLFALLILLVTTAVVLSRSLQSVQKKGGGASLNLNVKKTCPPGFVIVSRDATYKASDFCVMKYDAKCSNLNPKCVTSEGVYRNNISGCECQNKYQVVSAASGAPITYIPEDDGTTQSAKAYCKNAGWHLITNSEWMTIAKNVAGVSSNWCDKDGTNCENSLGTAGKILANGHNDTVPNKALPAGQDDQPCFGTTSDGSDKCGGKSSQKRTLTLDNGEIIWDFAGNVWQWVDATIARKDEPRSVIPNLGGSAWVWAEFQTVPHNSDYGPTDPNWNSKNGVGRIYHYNSFGDTDTTLYTYIRGGNWRHGADSGAFTIHMQPVPGKTNIDDVGFRCVTDPI
jgi:hypothetical protein